MDAIRALTAAQVPTTVSRGAPSPLRGLANHPAARIDTAQAGTSPSMAGINRLVESISGAANANTSQMPQFGGKAVRYGGNPNVRPPTQGMTQPPPNIAAQVQKPPGSWTDPTDRRFMVR